MSDAHPRVVTCQEVILKRLALKLLTLIPLIALTIGEIIIVFTSGGSQYRNVFLMIACCPLAIITLNVIANKNLFFSGITAWICIIIGACIQHDLHTSSDPSRCMMSLISICTYLILSIPALIGVMLSFGDFMDKIISKNKIDS